MFLLISNQNLKLIILDIAIERKNLNYILKFSLLANIA